MTAQAGELLVFKGNIYSMNCEPFSQFVQKNNLKLYFIATNSALWRGYFGEWEITDKKLYLTKISGNGKIRNQEKFRSGRLELRKKMKNGVITPQENGHLLKILKEDCLEDIELSLKSLFPFCHAKRKELMSAYLCWLSFSVAFCMRLSQLVPVKGRGSFTIFNCN